MNFESNLNPNGIKVGLVRDARFRDHETGSHPEHARRLDAIDRRLEKSGLLGRVQAIEFRPALLEDLHRVHDPEMIPRIEAFCAAGGGYFDINTVVGPASAEVALWAAGGLTAAVQRMMDGSIDRALALVRPPGHHATRFEPMGFCLYNHLAVGVKFLFHHYEVERVAIVDFDVHHGNGSQDIFFRDPDVFFFSIHQHPLFPMTGPAEETGEGPGRGTTLNLPLAPLTPRKRHLEQFERGLDQVFAFRPEFIFVSAGFDAHALDPLSVMELESEDFGTMTRSIVERSTAAGVRGVVSTLEGGYHLGALAESVQCHLEALLR